jgi:hypothetical protein
VVDDMREAAVHGFQVDPDALADYARVAGRVADDLGGLSNRELDRVHDLAAGGFGKIGDETGFTKALDEYGKALRHQVRTVGTRADALARGVSHTAAGYRDEEDGVTSNLLSLLRDSR